MERKGIIMVYTGDGKGKTTSAMGLVLRAVGHGHRVAIVQFLKGQPTGEVEAIARYLPGVEIHRFGRDVFIDPANPDPIDEKLAQDGLHTAVALLKSDFDLVVLDEVNVALDYALFNRHKLISAIEGRPSKMTVVLTGRGLVPDVERIADMISEVKEVRHHWRKGIPAQDGIEQ